MSVEGIFRLIEEIVLKFSNEDARKAALTFGQGIIDSSEEPDLKWSLMYSLWRESNAVVTAEAKAEKAALEAEQNAEKQAKKMAASEASKRDGNFARYLANCQVTGFDDALKFYAQWVRDEKDLGHENGQEFVEDRFHKIFVGLSSRVAALTNETVGSVGADVLKTLEDMKKFRVEEILHLVNEERAAWLKGQYAEMFKLTVAASQTEAWLSSEEQDLDWVNRGWTLLEGSLVAPWGFCPGEHEGERGEKTKLFPIRDTRPGKTGFFIPKTHVCRDCAHSRSQGGGKSLLKDKPVKTVQVSVPMDTTGWTAAEVETFYKEVKERRAKKFNQGGKGKKEEKRDKEEIPFTEPTPLSPKALAENAEAVARATGKAAKKAPAKGGIGKPAKKEIKGGQGGKSKKGK